MLREFDRFKEEGKTVVLVTHALDLLDRFCERVLLLDHGIVQNIGAPDDVIEAYRQSVLVG